MSNNDLVVLLTLLFSFVGAGALGYFAHKLPFTVDFLATLALIVSAVKSYRESTRLAFSSGFDFAFLWVHLSMVICLALGMWIASRRRARTGTGWGSSPGAPFFRRSHGGTKE